ncbi:cyclase family protein [Micromonospora sp. NPDC005413]|uniref:cyclase family protein n=1 Tax=Micromonospora sp. NPDC005413 TaxID=3154563 RepID=UPI0033A0A43C
MKNAIVGSYSSTIRATRSIRTTTAYAGQQQWDRDRLVRRRQDPGQGVFPDDLEEAERRQGVRVRSGDAVLLRTGYGRARHEAGEASVFTQAGWHASCLPWLHERGVALIGADTPQDVQPSGYEDVLMPVHAVSLVAMGLWLLDNCDLEACAATAAELGQWDLQLAVAPVRFAGTSGSPVNPIATF